MPVHQTSLAATQEPTSLNSENAAVHCAYRLISQLRQPFPAQSPVPRETHDSVDWQETKREARPRRAM